MFKAFEFCLPTLGKSVPAGPEWFHEIKYDGYRLRIERDGDRVRLITRGGYDWTRRYPRIVEAALKNRQKRFVLDGEAIIRGVDGYSDFNALHFVRHNDEVELIAFDLLGHGWRRLAEFAAINAQSQSAAPAIPPTGRHLRCRLRTG
jgi:bifunctional non-homologous end joining protein LigD